MSRVDRAFCCFAGWWLSHHCLFSSQVKIPLSAEVVRPYPEIESFGKHVAVNLNLGAVHREIICSVYCLSATLPWPWGRFLQTFMSLREVSKGLSGRVVNNPLRLWPFTKPLRKVWRNVGLEGTTVSPGFKKGSAATQTLCPFWWHQITTLVTSVAVTNLKHSAFSCLLSSLFTFGEAQI